MQYLALLYISCYIAEIWIAFLTVYSDKDWVSRQFVGGGFCVALTYSTEVYFDVLRILTVNLTIMLF